MTAIVFFDLETSDKECCGQILNYCFLCTGGGFKERELLQGTIALSRLQIPSAGALLANRIDLSKHQGDSEPVAMQKIWRFLEQCVQGNDGNPIVLCGYNSAKFDVPYLRTSMLRNGLNPYLNGRIIYRDVYHSAQFLALTNQDFKKKILDQAEGKLSLKLEVITKALGLLIGAQTHESKDDVLLLRDLCQYLDREYRFDPTRFLAYEATVGPKPSSSNQDTVTVSLSISRAEDAVEHCKKKIFWKFRDSPKQSIWLNLEAFKEGKKKEALTAFTKANAAFFIDAVRPLADDEKQLVAQAASELQQITLENFYETSTCDIELDIYRVGFPGNAALGEAIWNGDQASLRALNNKDANILLSRFKLANNELDDKLSETLRQYYGYRYGGKMQISRSADPERVRYHPTLTEMKAELNQKIIEMTNPEDMPILTSLQNYMQNPLFEGL